MWHASIMDLKPGHGPDQRTTALPDLPPYVVFFDGVCAYCDGAVKWLLHKDKEGILAFAPLQGETAARMRVTFPREFPEGTPDSMVFVDSTSGAPVLHRRASGARRIAEVMQLKTGKPAWLYRLPLPLADLGYRLFAATRYRRFGKFNTCTVPDPAQAHRFLP